jgi:hypothetical protein
MQHFNKHTDFYNQPICLSDQQIDQPQIVIKTFFENYHLHEVGQKLWDMFETAITSNNIFFEEADDVVLYFPFIINRRG